MRNEERSATNREIIACRARTGTGGREPRTKLGKSAKLAEKRDFFVGGRPTFRLALVFVNT